jgi:peptide deformylase
MAVREILLLGHPLLRKKCEKVTDFSDPIMRQTIVDLQDTLAHFRSTHGFGRGIAAPQIGVKKKIIFINIDTPTVLINPRITSRSKRMMLLWDDCFSFPEIMVKVRRHLDVHVAYQNETGKKETLEGTDGLSELLQHEIDHIDGILAIDRAIDSKHIIFRSEWKKMASSEKLFHQL